MPISQSRDKDIMLTEYRAWINQPGYGGSSFNPPPVTSDHNKVYSVNGWPIWKLLEAAGFKLVH